MKKVGACLLALALSLGVVGCSNKDTTTQSISGKVSLDGSTSMDKLVNGLKEAINEEYPDLILEPQFTGSGTGIQSLIDGNTDIANSSRALKEEEKAQGLVENIIALDGIAVIVDQNNSITTLTKQQLSDIYTGKIKNWKEVGGADQNIVVVGREEGSGTRDGFESILDIKGKCNLASTLNETGAVIAKVQTTPGAIGYASLDLVEGKGVRVVALDGIVPSQASILDGTYQLQRPFVMATQGTIEEQKPEVQAVFDFINSEKGQSVIQAVGLVIPRN